MGLPLRSPNVRAWLDASLIARLALAVMRDATGQAAPLEVLAPAAPAALRSGARVAFWSLTAGVGASTTAALVAQRSAAARAAPLLIDLDRWAPSLALRARIDGATVCDALLRPGREPELLSRWSEVSFLPGSADLHRAFAGERVLELVERTAASRPVVLDLGAGADALDLPILASLSRLCVVVGPRVAQLEAAFAAVPLLREVPCPVALVLVGAPPRDADAIASRLPWRSIASIPHDPFLADDRFAARAPTMRAVDTLIRGLR